MATPSMPELVPDKGSKPRLDEHARGKQPEHADRKQTSNCVSPASQNMVQSNSRSTSTLQSSPKAACSDFVQSGPKAVCSDVVQSGPKAVCSGVANRRRKEPAKTGRKRIVFVAAMLLFAAVNVVWAKTKFGVTSPTDFPYPTWTGTAIEDFLSNAKGRPQLAFLGSSLVLTTLGAVDATYEQKRIDAPYHHYSHYFEDKFKELTGQTISTFDFAIPGEMPSDAYFIIFRKP